MIGRHLLSRMMTDSAARQRTQVLLELDVHVVADRARLLVRPLLSA